MARKEKVETVHTPATPAEVQVGARSKHSLTALA
jgi:hypothetical protein